MIHDFKGRRKRYLISVLGIFSFALGGVMLMLILSDIIADSGQLPMLVPSEFYEWTFFGFFFVGLGLLMIIKGSGARNGGA